LPEYAWVGVGRTDGIDQVRLFSLQLSLFAYQSRFEKGEFAAILYRKTRIELIKNETIWLSQTPHVIGSRGWDAALERIMSWYSRAPSSD